MRRVQVICGLRILNDSKNDKNDSPSVPSPTSGRDMMEEAILGVFAIEFGMGYEWSKTEICRQEAVRIDL